MFNVNDTVARLWEIKKKTNAIIGINTDDELKLISVSNKKIINWNYWI